MPRARNHQAEYARRIASAERRGLSRSQARGHARVGEQTARPPTDAERDRFEIALKRYRKTRNQAAAAKELRLSTERFRRFLKENVEVEGRGRTLKIIDHRTHEMLVISDGEMNMLPISGFEQKSLNGRYLNAVKAFLSEPERIDELLYFADKALADAKGKSHVFETDPNTLLELDHAEDGIFPDVYKLVT